MIVLFSVIVYADSYGSTYVYSISEVEMCPPEDGDDWNVTIAQNILCEDKYIILNGSLFVNGILTFRNVTLLINNSYDGEHKIDVNSSGEFYIFDKDLDSSTTYDASNITAYYPSNQFNFFVNQSSKFKIYNSFLSYAGWNDTNEGLKIYTNDTRIINNTISNNYIGFSLSGASNNTFINNNISSTSYDFNLSSISINNTALNNTFNKSKVSILDTSNLTIKWYLDIYINDGTNPISEATVNITDNKSTQVFSGITYSTGYIDRQIVIEYVANNTTNDYHTPHNITASKSDYYSNSTSINVNESKTVDLTLSAIPVTPPPPPPPGGGFILPVCGNGRCEWGETSENCPEDCPPAVTPIVLDIDVSVETGSEQVLAGQRVYATIIIQKAGGPAGPTDVNLTYWIRDLEGKTVDYKKTTIAVETIRRDIYFLSVPPASSLGVYTFEASVAYNNVIDTSSATFQVVAEIPKALIVIKSIDVPLMFEGDKNIITVILENQIENPLNVNVSIFFPEKFELKEINKTAVIEPLSEEIFTFLVTPMVSGSFNGFISIKYDGRGLTRDFPINVYPPIIKWGWIIVIVLLIIILIVVYRRKRVKRYHELTLARLRALRRRRR